MRKFGLLAWGLNELDDDEEYWERVRWRASWYEDNDDDDDVDNVGDRRRDERDLKMIFGCFTFDVDFFVEDNELEFVPSERNAESEDVVVVVVGWFRVIVIGDLDVDDGELLDCRRVIVPFGELILFCRII